MKKTIRLTEGQLRRIIRKVLIEGTPWEDAISDVRQRSEKQKEKTFSQNQILKFDEFTKTVKELWPRAVIRSNYNIHYEDHEATDNSMKKFEDILSRDNTTNFWYRAGVTEIVGNKREYFEIKYSTQTLVWKFIYENMEGRADTIHGALDKCKEIFQKYINMIPISIGSKNTDMEDSSNYFNVFKNSILRFDPTAKYKFDNESPKVEPLIYYFENSSNKPNFKFSTNFYYKNGENWYTEFKLKRKNENDEDKIFSGNGATLDSSLQKLKAKMINTMEMVFPY